MCQPAAHAPRGFLPRTLVASFVVVCWACSGRADRPDFETEVAPILVKRCLECHQQPDVAGGLNLTTRKGLLRGGESGAVIDSKKIEESILVQRVVDGEMPPEQHGRSRRLPESEIDVLRRWVRAGAEWPTNRTLDWFERTNEVRGGLDWWSFQKVTQPPVPPLSGRQVENPIDAFVFARLEANSMTPAPQADKRTLIRRLHYDLIGLPPSREQVEAFVADEDPDAWTRMIDRLLDQPQYGERWARHWLDVVRYADSYGYERDQEIPFAWKYRDWVVNALNDDIPYSDFIIDQLAGDEVADRDEQSVIATGFLRLGTWNDEPNDPRDYVYDRLEDVVHTTSSAFLGLTVKCARCHSHKFDPIRQQDYYRMASAFWAGPIQPRDRKWLGGPTPDELGSKDVSGWTDLSSLPPPLRLLRNGEREQPMGIVIPASLSTIPSLETEFSAPPKGAPTSHRRLQLAKWIANEKNPLTPRVLVNRLWQHHFGKAIVRTPNNFGYLSDPPTHPALLDWLAAEFVRCGGSIKQMHRLILTSETWRQSSIHPEQTRYHQLDAANRLWWRSELRRLDAESIRDSMLAASGELELKVGGPSFKPTISPEALEGLSRKSAAWQPSPPAEQNRRSLYAFLKRGLLPPMMTAFDLGDATASCGKRNVTTVPTQALAMMNNRFVHERGLRLARDAVANANEPKGQVDRIYSSILRRRPTKHEIERSLRHIVTQRETYWRAITKNNSDDAIRHRLTESLMLHLRADQAITDDHQRVTKVVDLSPGASHALQDDPQRRPRFRREGFGGHPTILFEGGRSFLKLSHSPIDQQEFTIIVVANDLGTDGHREIISNWSAGKNVGTSIFLGLTGEKTVRLSDAFASAGELRDRHRAFVLSAVNGRGRAAVYQNGLEIAAMNKTLPERKLDTEWVIGQQGNIDGEFWRGGVAEIRVYGRALSDEERQAVERQLGDRYGLEIASIQENPSPELLALASLCHVLFNSNEFLYVD